MNTGRAEIENVIWRIRDDMRSSNFDCRQLLHKYDDPEYIFNMTEEFRKGYMVPKNSVAKILQPRKICEIGVYRGIAALSFLAACPDAEYVGIDCTPEPWVWDSKRIFDQLGYKVTILHQNSQILSAIPGGPYDLIHVDGDHSKDGAKNDVKLAFHAVASTGYILIDDAVDCQVCAGTWEAMKELPGGNVNWNYVEGTTGSMIIERLRQ